jgi:futalosine hydrolase
LPTAFAWAAALAAKPIRSGINLGIAGSFDRNIALGDVVEITEDTFAELGAEDDEAFISICPHWFWRKHFYPNNIA